MVVLPLHIFEPRYRSMIEDSLDGPGRLVLATIQEGHEKDSSGTPPFYPVAGFGEIGRHERLADGRFNIFLVGLKRVWVQEVPSDKLYRKVEIQPIEEIDVPKQQAKELRPEILAAIQERSGEIEAEGEDDLEDDEYEDVEDEDDGYEYEEEEEYEDDEEYEEDE